MLKFLRKYNALILVVGGSFLMVVFLLPQAIQQFGPNPLNRPMFEAYGETFDGAEVQAARHEVEILSRSGLMAQMRYPGPLSDTVRRIDPVHWMLLTQEAQRAGLINPGATAEQLLMRAAQNRADMLNAQGAQFGLQVTPEEMFAQYENAYAIAAGQVRGGAEVGLRALRHMDAYQRLIEAAYGYGQLSLQELAAEAVESQTQAEIDLAVIRGLDFARDRNIAEPSEAELQEFFEQYRASRPDENRFGLSYRLPPAVKLEVLLIDREIVANAVELDPIEVRKYFMQNEDSFDGDFASARLSVEAQVRQREADRLMRVARDAVEDVRVRAQARLRRTDEGFRELPDNWSETRPSIDELVQAANDALASEISPREPAARAILLDDIFYSRTDLARVSDAPMQRLSASVGGQNVALASVAVRVRELAEEGQAVIGLQEGLLFGPLSGRGGVQDTGNIGFIRVVDVRPEGPAASLDQVRERVEEDWIAVRGYRVLENTASTFAQRAIEAEGDLNVVVETLPQDQRLVARQATVQRDFVVGSPSAQGAATSATRLANTEAFRARVRELVMEFDPMTPMSEVPFEDRIIAVPLPENRALAVAFIRGQRPVTRERVRNAEGTFGRQLIGKVEPGIGASLWFENMRERADFSDLSNGDLFGEDEMVEDESDDAAEDQDAEAAVSD
jgi:hypothetical protein